MALCILYDRCELGGNRARNANTVVRYRVFFSKKSLSFRKYLENRWTDFQSENCIRKVLLWPTTLPLSEYDPSWNKEVTDEKLSRRTLMTSFGGHRSPTSWVRSCKLGMQLDLYAIYVCCEFKRIRAINMVPMPEKPHFWPDDVTLGVNYPPSSWARTSKLGVQWGQIVPYRSPRLNGWT